MLELEHDPQQVRLLSKNVRRETLGRSDYAIQPSVLS
jgi:hypothetical protein